MRVSASVVFLLAMWGCGAEPDDSPLAEPTADPVAPEKPPTGRIGGEPILPKPVVLGGIENDAVEEAIATHRDAIVACYEEERAKAPDLAGKVLVRFTIGADGRVAEVSTRSTSLRHEPTETCVEQVIAKAIFPALSRGHVAIVSYPFVF